MYGFMNYLDLIIANKTFMLSLCRVYGTLLLLEWAILIFKVCALLYEVTNWVMIVGHDQSWHLITLFNNIDMVDKIINI